MQGQETKRGLEVEGEERKQNQWVTGTSIADRIEQVWNGEEVEKEE